MRIELPNFLRLKCYFPVLLLCLQFTAWTQNERSVDSLRKEIGRNKIFLNSNAIVLYNGWIPFRENNKLGIKNTRAEIVLPAVYDSILQTDPFHFITVKGNKYQLLDYDLWNWFDPSVTSISFDRHQSTYTVTDSSRKTSMYLVNNYGGGIMPLNGSNNHLLYKPLDLKIKPQQAHNYTDVPENAFYDSIQFYRYPEVNELVVYKNGSVYGRKSWGLRESSNFHGTDYISFSTHKGDSLQYEVYNLRKHAGWFVEAGMVQDLFYEGEHYVLASDCPGNARTRIFTMEGMQVLASEEALQYAEGMLFKIDKKVYPKLDLYTLYTFPGKQLIALGLTHLSYNTPFVIGSTEEGEKSDIFYKGKRIYSLKKPRNYISSFALKPGGKNAIACVESSNKKGKNRHFTLISSTGKVFAESKSLIECFYNEDFKQVRVSFESKGKNGVEVQFGLYDDEKDQIKMIPYDAFLFTQINSGTLLLSDYYYNFKTGDGNEYFYFTDLDGNCLKEDVFENAKIHSYYNTPKLVEVEQNSIPAVYDINLGKVCDLCAVELVEFKLKKSNYLLLKYDLNDVYVQVFDEHGNLVLPGRYLAVYVAGSYFAVLEKDGQINYIPIAK